MSSQPQSRTLLRDPENTHDYLQDKPLQSLNKRLQLWKKLFPKRDSWRKKQRMKQMVGWYNPVQLLRTGREVLISTIFGQHADRRLVQALTAEKALVFDYQGEKYEDIEIENIKTGDYLKVKDERLSDEDLREEIWIDYVGDVGDGWNSTYGVAYWLAQEKLPFQAKDAKEKECELRRGDILIFGGDEVYPIANHEEYKDRLVEPYRSAFEPQGAQSILEPKPKPLPLPHVYAIPGNHDWYDSLGAFTRIFCDENDKNFAGGSWNAPQNRSYFAMRLPGNWWLIGIDLQLNSDLDAVQLQYFSMVAKEMQDGDRVILCSPEPYWAYQIAYGENDRNKDSRLNQEYLEKYVFKDVKISVYIAGDLHHYFHMCTKDEKHKVTSGGGGAFMHPTHGEFGERFDRKLKAQGDKVVTRYPEISDSRRRAWRNLLFPFLNPQFGIVTAILYWLTAWTVMGAIPRVGSTVTSWQGALNLTLRALVETPVALPWMLAILAGFLMFTDTHSKSYRFIGGLFHGFTHIAMVFCVGWTAYWCDPWEIRPDTPIPQILTWGLLVMVGGYFVGAFVMGIYLLISINVFGRHSTEAFSSLKTQDWKNFLRLKIDREGHLTIFPIGIRRVPRKWRERRPDENGVSKYRPEGKHTEPELIGVPICIK